MSGGGSSNHCCHQTPAKEPDRLKTIVESFAYVKQLRGLATRRDKFPIANRTAVVIRVTLAWLR